MGFVFNARVEPTYEGDDALKISIPREIVEAVGIKKTHIPDDGSRSSQVRYQKIKCVADPETGALTITQSPE